MSPERNIINPREENVISHIDMTLEDYDRVIEEANLKDLYLMVEQGIIDTDEADRRFRTWFNRRHRIVE